MTCSSSDAVVVQTDALLSSPTPVAFSVSVIRLLRQKAPFINCFAPRTSLSLRFVSATLSLLEEDRQASGVSHRYSSGLISVTIIGAAWHASSASSRILRAGCDISPETEEAAQARPHLRAAILQRTRTAVVFKLEQVAPGPTMGSSELVVQFDWRLSAGTCGGELQRSRHYHLSRYLAHTGVSRRDYSRATSRRCWKAR